jgi:hypothetical protein
VGKAVVGAVVGLLAGVAVTAGLLRGTNVVVNRLKGKVFEMEPGTIYVSVVLGAGFGAVSGALAGLAGAVARAGRERSTAPPAPPSQGQRVGSG